MLSENTTNVAPPFTPKEIQISFSPKAEVGKASIWMLPHNHHTILLQCYLVEGADFKVRGFSVKLLSHLFLQGKKGEWRGPAAAKRGLGSGVCGCHFYSASCCRWWHRHISPLSRGYSLNLIMNCLDLCGWWLEHGEPTHEHSRDQNAENVAQKREKDQRGKLIKSSPQVLKYGSSGERFWEAMDMIST